MDLNFLSRAVEFNKNEPHQIDAFNWLKFRLESNGYGKIDFNDKTKLDSLWAKLSKETQNEFIDRYRNEKEVLAVGTVEFEVAYYSQLDNKIKPYVTCNSSSNAMLLKTMVPKALGDGKTADDDYVAKIMSGTFGYRGYLNPSIYHEVHSRALAWYGLKTVWRTDGDRGKIKDLLKTQPVVVNILHKGKVGNLSGGHIIVLTDYKDGVFGVNDPFGCLNYATGVYNTKASGVYNVSENAFFARWQGGYREVF